MFFKSSLVHLLVLAPLVLAAPAKDGSKDKDAATKKPGSASKTSSASTASESGASGGGSSAGTAASSGGDVSGFEWDKWTLQLPISATKGGSPMSASSSEFANGQSKPAWKEYYFMKENALVMKVPEKSKCATTTNSQHCRTEFREKASFDPKAKLNRLHGTLQGVNLGSKSVCIGQIHIDDKISKKPVAELYYSSGGQLSFGVSKNKDGGQGTAKPLTKVPVGTKFSYTIGYEAGAGGKDVLYVVINGKRFPDGTAGFPNEIGGPSSYFKAGNYNQGDTPSEVHFFGVKTEHSK